MPFGGYRDRYDSGGYFPYPEHRATVAHVPKVESDEATLPDELEELIAEDTVEHSPAVLVDSPVHYPVDCRYF